MKLYGYRSALIKFKNRGLCYCMDCYSEELANRGCRKRNRKRARRWAKQDIKERLEL